jgi:hypothetical protein
MANTPAKSLQQRQIASKVVLIHLSGSMLTASSVETEAALEVKIGTVTDELELTSLATRTDWLFLMTEFDMAAAYEFETDPLIEDEKAAAVKIDRCLD